MTLKAFNEETDGFGEETVKITEKNEIKCWELIQILICNNCLLKASEQLTVICLVVHIQCAGRGAR